jgi:hypothetical protein
MPTIDAPAPHPSQKAFSLILLVQSGELIFNYHHLLQGNKFEKY